MKKFKRYIKFNIFSYKSRYSIDVTIDEVLSAFQLHLPPDLLSHVTYGSYAYTPSFVPPKFSVSTVDSHPFILYC